MALIEQMLSQTKTVQRKRAEHKPCGPVLPQILNSQHCHSRASTPLEAGAHRWLEHANPSSARELQQAQVRQVFKLLPVMKMFFQTLIHSI